MTISMAVCVFSGYSHLNRESSSERTQEVTEKATEEKTESTEAQEISDDGKLIYNNIKYKVNSELIDITEIAGFSGPAYTYGTGGDIVLSFPAWFDSGTKSTQTKLDWLNKVVFADYQNKTTEIIEDEEYDIAIFSSDNPVEGNDKPTRTADFIISRRNHPLDNFTVSVTFTKDSDEKLIRELGLETLKSVEYIGEKPTEPVTMKYDCEYFSYEIPAEFSDKIKLKSNEKENSIGIEYAYAETISENSSVMYIDAFADSEFDTSEEYLKNEYSQLNKEKEIIIKEPYKTELLGYDCWAMEYSKELYKTFGTQIKTQYVLEKGGVFCDILLAVNEIDDPEQVTADFEKLIDNIIIK